MEKYYILNKRKRVVKNYENRFYKYYGDTRQYPIYKFDYECCKYLKEINFDNHKISLNDVSIIFIRMLKNR